MSSPGDSTYTISTYISLTFANSLLLLSRNNDISPPIDITNLLNDLDLNVLTRRALLKAVTVNPDIKATDLFKDISASIIARSLLEDVTVSPPIDISDVLNNVDADVLTRSLLEDVTISPPIDISNVLNDLDLDVASA